MAVKKNATPAQIALAWLVAQKPWIVLIRGPRNLDHLGENHGSLRVQLTGADLAEIEAALSNIEVHSGRMGETFMQDVDKT
jgi:aryl-alcohol dehydrogenase-like predicted oxidoreductase